MFYSVPISNEQVITTTPIGAKCVTHLFFESKNDGVFYYKEKQDSVTITIAGKMVCRDMPILPFLSSTPYGVNRHNWQDVALEMGINVDMSEIKISAADTNNDFNVVFVCSDKPNEDFRGFDFVECKKFVLEKKFMISNEEANQLYKKALSATNKRVSLFDKTQIEGLELGTKIEFRTKITKEQYDATNSQDDEVASDMLNILDGLNQDDCEIVCGTFHYSGFYMHDLGQGEIFSQGYDGFLRRSALYIDDKAVRRVVSDPSDWAAIIAYLSRELQSIIHTWTLGREHTIKLDHAPQMMFSFSRKSAGSILRENNQRLNITLSGSDEQVLPPNTDLDCFMAKDNVPWRKAVHTFDSTMPKTLQIMLNSNKYTPTIDRNDTLQLFFIYKKLI
ncbi:MAG: hypothetical protein IKR17_04745 [Bacteroidales bacterium]|nr:hypothetical protein [Bacteroidales bacterium]